MRFTWLIIPLLCAAAAAQSPATRPLPPSRPASRPTATLKNIDRALQDNISIDADALPFSAFIDSLADKTQTNIVTNWIALSRAGITKDTPITLHLKDIPYESVIQTLMEVLPATTSHPNYTVGDNTLEITTNAELGVDLATHVYDFSRATAYTFAASLTKDRQDQNGKDLEVVIRAELVRAGEPMDGKGHELHVKDGNLVATVSDRAQVVIGRAILLFNNPLKLGQLASGTQLTAAAKRTSDAYKAVNAAKNPVTPDVIAKDPKKFSQFNIALLPGTQVDLAKDTPDIYYAVNNGGILLLGPRDILRTRTQMAVYDVRDLMKRLAAKNKIQPAPTADEFQSAIVQILQTNIKPELTGTFGGPADLGKTPSVILPYNGLLIIFATQETHRMVASALQDLNK